MVLHRALGQMQPLGDLGIGQPIGQQTEHFQLPFAEIGPDGAVLRACARLGQLLEQFSGHAGVHIGAALDRAADGGNQILARRILEQIAVGPGTDGVKDPAVVIVGGQHQHTRLRKTFTDTARGLDAVHDGHAQIHEHQVRRKLLDQIDSLRTVMGHGHDLEAGHGAQDHL